MPLAVEDVSLAVEDMSLAVRATLFPSENKVAFRTAPGRGTEERAVLDSVSEDDGPAGFDADEGYMTDRFRGAGSSKVSWVGLTQSGVPSELVEQQRHNLA